MDDKKLNNILKTNLNFSILNIDILNNKNILCRKDIKIINKNGWIFPCINCGSYTNYYISNFINNKNYDLYMCRNCSSYINPNTDYILKNYIKNKYLL